MKDEGEKGGKNLLTVTGVAIGQCCQWVALREEMSSVHGWAEAIESDKKSFLFFIVRKIS